MDPNKMKKQKISYSFLGMVNLWRGFGENWCNGMESIWSHPWLYMPPLRHRPNCASEAFTYGCCSSNSTDHLVHCQNSSSVTDVDGQEVRFWLWWCGFGVWIILESVCIYRQKKKRLINCNTRCWEREGKTWKQSFTHGQEEVGGQCQLLVVWLYKIPSPPTWDKLN